MAQEEQIKSRLGPPRTSFLDDISFYLQTYSSTLDLSDSSSLRVFVAKITASHYLKLAEFLRSITEGVQWKLSRRSDLTSFAVSAVEELWSDVQSWKRRIGEYKDDLEAIMLQLRIPLAIPDLSRTEKWTDCAADYQFLLMSFKEIEQRVNSLNNSIAALTSIAGNRQAFKDQELSLKAAERSIREAKSAKALTILGIVFIPLAFTSSLFSMSDSYLPGGEPFWLYFVVSLPLVGLVFVAYYILELGYSNSGTQWSLRTFMHTAKEKVVHNSKRKGLEV